MNTIMLRRLGLFAAAAGLVTTLAGCSSPDPSGNPNATAASAVLDSIAVPGAGASKTLDRIKDKGVLRAGVIAAAPFSLQDPVNSNWYGPAPDVVSALAQKLDVKVEWVVTDFDTIVAGLQADKYDIATTSLYATAERKKVVDFVNYAKAGACYVARKDDDRISSLADLNNSDVKVLVVSGSSFVTDFPKKYPEANLSAKPLPPGAGIFFSEVTSKRFDVTPIESTLAKQVAAQQPDLKILPDAETCLTNPDIPQDVGLAVRKGDDEFRELLQATATALQPVTDKSVVKYSSEAGK
ncbi:substrate-binding periplasmic protein [Paenarthrobacter sp. NPDC057981]|uniref:substrate-binding periplasmic protein n=1 Tax=Paenarthrobacter sp. NPDC057981 TaxID=3346297 RepID=UPI0036DCA441